MNKGSKSKKKQNRKSISFDIKLGEYSDCNIFSTKAGRLICVKEFDII